MTAPLNRFLTLIALGIALSMPLHGQDAPETAEPDAPKAEMKDDLGKPPIDLLAKQQRLLGKELSKDALVWLETQEGKFIAMWERDTSGNPSGAVLMLHGEGQTADWPVSMKALRLALAQHGWSTLSISLPPAIRRHIPARTKPGSEAEATDDAPNKAKAEPPDPQKNSLEPVQRRIDAGMNFLNQNGQFNIVILGEGLGAKRAAEYIRPPDGATNGAGNTSAMQGKLRALIMINARNTTTQSENALPDLLKNRILPVLDLYYGDHYLDETEAAARSYAAKKHRLMYYQQFKILEPDAAQPHANSENRLTRRVRGFLNKYAKGVEIEGAR